MVGWIVPGFQKLARTCGLNVNVECKRRLLCMQCRYAHSEAQTVALNPTNRCFPFDAGLNLIKTSFPDDAMTGLDHDPREMCGCWGNSLVLLFAPSYICKTEPEKRWMLASRFHWPFQWKKKQDQSCFRCFSAAGVNPGWQWYSFDYTFILERVDIR